MEVFSSVLVLLSLQIKYKQKNSEQPRKKSLTNRPSVAKMKSQGARLIKGREQMRDVWLMRRESVRFTKKSKNSYKMRDIR
jgi:hypothetical protein